jgi:uncharacterized protein
MRHLPSRQLLAAALVSVTALIGSATALAAPEFPELSGRVVDEAGMLSAAAEREIGELAAAHEQASGNQVVVATVPDLQGYGIEEFGYQLGRHWGIGQKGKDNGVLLLIAKAERKVRIEVGYGLEGELTDAIASNIIATVITPPFKLARFDDGAVAGTRAIIDAIGGQYQMRQAAEPAGPQVPTLWKLLAFVIIFFILPTLFGRSFFGGLLLGGLLSGGRGGHRGGGGFGGGGFSGGGGSFGGGGASGGW